MKKCSKCGEVKPRAEFGKDKSKKDGLRYDCKSCANKRGRAYYHNNKEVCAARAKKWREENPDRVKELWARWSSENDRSEYMKRYSDENREKAAHYNLRYRYGIDMEEYEKMLEDQGGVCKICGEPGTPQATGVDENVWSRSLAVDHCHKTGQIRGLLCASCNWGIGNFQDNPELLASAIRYLEDVCEVVYS